MQKTLSVLTVTISGLILFGCNIPNKPKEEKINSPEKVTATKEIPSATPEIPETAFEYTWYEDDYVKFQYPKGWKTEVKSGKTKVQNPYEPETKIDYDGVETIIISDPKEESTLSVYDSTFNPFGFETVYNYDEKNPLILEENNMDETTELKLETKPIIRDIEKVKASILFFGKSSRPDSEPQETGLLLAEREGTKYNANTIFFLNKTMAVGQLHLKPTKEIQTQTNLFSLTCEVASTKDADKCSEFVNKFFDSVNRKK